MRTKYKNDCGHREEDFIGVVNIGKHQGDLYIYKSDLAGVYDPKGEAHYCFKYSKEDGDYISGELKMLFARLKDNCMK